MHVSHRHRTFNQFTCVKFFLPNVSTRLFRRDSKIELMKTCYPLKKGQTILLIQSDEIVVVKNYKTVTPSL